jgi:hypothetical protein
MTAEVFRFVSVRPPQRTEEIDEANDATIRLEYPDSQFVEALRRARVAGAAGEMLAIARRFIGSDAFVGSRRAIDPPFAALTDALHRLRGPGFADAGAAAVSRILETTPAKVVTTPAYRAMWSRTADSLVAATIDDATRPATRSLLVRLARTLWAVARLADEARLTRDTFMAGRLVVPSGILPLPLVPPETPQPTSTNGEDSQREFERVAAELAASRHASDELVAALERTGGEPTGRAARGRSAGFALPAEAVATLSAPTREALDAVGANGGRVDVAKAISLLDRRAGDLARRLHADTGSAGGVVRVGNQLVPAGTFDGTLRPFPFPRPPKPLRPGPCPPRPATTPDAGITVPSGSGEARVLGMADLMVLEQSLLRYELGEIAHIENVLLNERRSRKFRTATTTERTELVETETIETKEHDLSSTERFELQTESQTVVNQQASSEMGITVSASYGPSVEVTANYNVASTTSREESSRAAATYAREVTTKAVQRVQQRALKRRFVRTVTETEETNQHGFDNRGGQGDIVGVYRFVDKIYRAQVVNYGKRLLLEFLVPEPAAFLRYAMTRRPLDETFPPKPEPPGYCLADGTSFAPLQPTDVTRDNYTYWAGKYGAQDVTPPPPQFVIAQEAKKSPEEMPTINTDVKVNSDLLDVTISDGYLCQSAFVNLYGETQAGPHKLVIQVQDKQTFYTEPTDDGFTWALRVEPTPKLSVTLNALRFHNYEMLVTVFCTLSKEKYEEWQLKTYASIMGAYADQKSRYDTAVAEARLRAEDAAVTGSNPALNRERERTELKKGCIALLTGQRFDVFDAVGRNVAPFGYPEVDFAEAKAEAPWVQAFEQAFEWNNMTYVFYPYFWGSKAEWPALAQLSDGDPLYASFLQAGAARVQVPARPGFDDQVVSYMSTKKLWTAAEGAVVSGGDGKGEDEELHISVLDELRSQTGNNDVEGVGTVSVIQGSAAVTGDDTAFTKDDVRRRISIGGVIYVIKAFTDATHVTLAAPYAGPSDTELPYSLGGVLVGEPWEVRLPTNLVKLDASLPIT